jgi:2-C-methyl-D-erythritol 4-phosphate cytidylyltransferase
LRAAGCDPVVVVVPPGALPAARSALDDRAVLVEGGSSRTQSVRNGLALVETDTVLVHDAVRPVITIDLVVKVASAVGDADGAIAAVPVEETLKRAENSEIRETVNRTDLWRAQTPQAFRTLILKEAHERADVEKFTVTDDAQLVERYGGRVRIVLGDRSNIKVTWPSDFELAEALLGARG